MTCSWCSKQALYHERNVYACREHKSKLRPAIRHDDGFSRREDSRPYQKTLFRKAVK